MIVITGASSGLGAALAKQYDEQDARIHLTGRSEQKLLHVTSQLSSNTTYQACDLANHKDVESLFEQLDEVPTWLVLLRTTCL
ncbi:SDR family NAD(P)-dependent oxidoreductase, partial [Vibrio tubiashii]